MPAAATAALDTAVRAGAVPLLARMLQRGCVENQIEAAWCLTNVAAAGAHELPRVEAAASGLAKAAAGSANANADADVNADQLHPALIAAPFLINLLSSTDALLQVHRMPDDILRVCCLRCFGLCLHFSNFLIEHVAINLCFDVICNFRSPLHGHSVISQPSLLARAKLCFATVW